ncbi:MAG: S1 RNA-binding domain-containing protein [Planctomycetaceae bacterium]|jgi:small subunit ribosomal protein S1|nr:S1 RNA-binding domain-containing protein [Planctomycetaceae bacterium]
MFSEIESSDNSSAADTGADFVSSNVTPATLSDKLSSIESIESIDAPHDAQKADSNAVSPATPPVVDPPRQTAQTPPVARPKRLIGSQRNPEAYRAQPTIKVVDPTTPDNNQNTNSDNKQNSNLDANQIDVTDPKNNDKIDRPENVAQNNDDASAAVAKEADKDAGKNKLSELRVPSSGRVAIPKMRGGKMSADLEAEFDAVMNYGSLDGADSLGNLMDKASELVDKAVIEVGTKLKAKVLAVRGDSLFLDLNAREQGVVLLNMFPPDAEPKAGDEIEVTVGKLDLDEGLYDVTVPLAAADVREWSQVQEGMIVDAKITKTNNGGLECEVNRLRGFIPISQIDLFRVENLEQYVGQKFTCVVEEVDQERRNLVLSRRSMLQREREEKRKELIAELAVGQIREGLVRKIIDGGVFVDLGGVDGFVPIGKLAWGRVRHPSDVVSEGKRISVRIDKIEEGTNKISLTYRDDASNPWTNIFERFQEKSQARGKVTKITEFGAFIELMPGVEGLVHISELSHKHVNNVHEVLKEGEWTDVFIVSIDTETKRIALSIRQLTPVEQPEEKTEPKSDESKTETDPSQTPDKDDSKNKNKRKMEGIPAPIKIKTTHKGQLKGGIGGNSNELLFGEK